MSAANNAMNNALVKFIKKPQYSPGPLPYLDKTYWRSLRQKADPALRNAYITEGRAIVEYVIFIKMVDSGELPNNPPGYLKAVTSSITSHKSVHAFLENLNPLMVEGVGTKVAEPFFGFVGAEWNQAKKSTDHSARWLAAILEPLIRVAGDAYVKEPRRNETRLSAQAQESNDRADSNFILFENMELIQAAVYESDTELAESDSSTTFPSRPSPVRPPLREPSPPGIAPFDEDGKISPLGATWALQLASHRASPRRPLPDDPNPDFLLWHNLPGSSGIELELGIDEISAGTRSFAASFSPSEKRTTWSTPEAFGDDDGPSPSRPTSKRGKWSSKTSPPTRETKCISIVEYAGNQSLEWEWIPPRNLTKFVKRVLKSSAHASFAPSATPSTYAPTAIWTLLKAATSIRKTLLLESGQIVSIWHNRVKRS
ncbi:hypothetical protein C8R44DRAFT_854477 [Mycena epipterygia]|nr:hypothetical protein C8R44DRAFT_854477 [Mycena epipterygia]